MFDWNTAKVRARPWERTFLTNHIFYEKRGIYRAETAENL